MNKEELAKSLAELYPALIPESQKKKNSYYTWMFEAVALGHVCFNQLDN